MKFLFFDIKVPSEFSTFKRMSHKASNVTHSTYEIPCHFQACKVEVKFHDSPGHGALLRSWDI